MTTLVITPNWKNKTAKFKGTVAAGELVAVSIANDNGSGAAYVTDATNLRLRAVDISGKTLAVFPLWTEENRDNWPDDVTEPDSWGDEDLRPLECVLNLNTAEILQAVPCGATLQFLFVLDDPVNDTLYFKDLCEVTHWPHKDGEDVPVDLSGYRDFVEEVKEDVEALDASVSALEASKADAAATSAALAALDARAATLETSKADATATSAALASLGTRVDTLDGYPHIEIDSTTGTPVIVIP